MKKTKSVIILTIAALGLAWLLHDRFSGVSIADAETDSRVAVHVAPIGRAAMRSYVTAYGNVQPEPGGARGAGAARIAPSSAGIVAAVHVSEGQRVTKGEVLFELDSRAADVAVDFAERTLERQRELMKGGGTSPKAIQQAEQQVHEARIQRAYLRVTAPLSGTVTRVNAATGEAVDPANVLAEVVDLDRLIAGGTLPATEVTALRAGASAEVSPTANGAAIPGSLTYVGAVADPQTGAVPIRVSLPVDVGLRPGQFVRIRIVNHEQPDCLTVPGDSIVRDADGNTVIAVVNDGKARLTAVTTGLQDGDMVQIDGDGLQAGMMVVTQGAYALPDGTNVRVIEN